MRPLYHFQFVNLFSSSIFLHWCYMYRFRMDESKSETNVKSCGECTIIRYIFRVMYEKNSVWCNGIIKVFQLMDSHVWFHTWMLLYRMSCLWPFLFCVFVYPSFLADNLRCWFADSYGPSILIIFESMFITSLLSLLICRLMAAHHVYSIRVHFVWYTWYQSSLVAFECFSSVVNNWSSAC
jgi:hypothetical protein